MNGKQRVVRSSDAHVIKRAAVAFILTLLLTLALPAEAEQTARLDVLTLQSRALKGNPLHDPAVRSVAVLVPAQFTNGMDVPVVYYLPGYGSSSENVIKNPGAWLTLVQRLTDQSIPVVLVVVDGRTVGEAVSI